MSFCSNHSPHTKCMPQVAHILLQLHAHLFASQGLAQVGHQMARHLPSTLGLGLCRRAVQAQLGQVIAIASSQARRLVASGVRVGIGGLSTLSQVALGSTLFQQGVPLRQVHAGLTYRLPLLCRVRMARVVRDLRVSRPCTSGLRWAASTIGRNRSVGTLPEKPMCTNLLIVVVAAMKGWLG